MQLAVHTLLLFNRSKQSSITTLCVKGLVPTQNMAMDYKEKSLVGQRSHSFNTLNLLVFLADVSILICFGGRVTGNESVVLILLHST